MRSPTSPTADVLRQLRQQIRALEGRPGMAPCPASAAKAPGPAPADGLSLAGLPQPGVVEVFGPRGCGRTRLALQLAADATRHGRVAWIDPARRMYPPSAEALGVVLSRLLIVRPPVQRVAWTVEQITRSGCFGLVVVGDGTELGKAGRLWARASRLGSCTLLMVNERSHGGLPASLRIEVASDGATVRRDRRGRTGHTYALPAWPDTVVPLPCS